MREQDDFPLGVDVFSVFSALRQEATGSRVRLMLKAERLNVNFTSVINNFTSVINFHECALKLMKLVKLTDALLVQAEGRVGRQDRKQVRSVVTGNVATFTGNVATFPLCT